MKQKVINVEIQQKLTIKDETTKEKEKEERDIQRMREMIAKKSEIERRKKY